MVIYTLPSFFTFTHPSVFLCTSSHICTYPVSLCTSSHLLHTYPVSPLPFFQFLFTLLHTSAYTQFLLTVSISFSFAHMTQILLNFLQFLLAHTHNFEHTQFLLSFSFAHMTPFLLTVSSSFSFAHTSCFSSQFPLISPLHTHAQFTPSFLKFLFHTHTHLVFSSSFSFAHTQFLPSFSFVHACPVSPHSFLQLLFCTHTQFFHTVSPVSSLYTCPVSLPHTHISAHNQFLLTHTLPSLHTHPFTPPWHSPHSSGFSSLLSSQSASPSHFHLRGMHFPLPHLSSVGSHGLAAKKREERMSGMWFFAGLWC